MRLFIDGKRAASKSGTERTELELLYVSVFSPSLSAAPPLRFPLSSALWDSPGFFSGGLPPPLFKMLRAAHLSLVCLEVRQRTRPVLLLRNERRLRRGSDQVFLLSSGTSALTYSRGEGGNGRRPRQGFPRQAGYVEGGGMLQPGCWDASVCYSVCERRRSSNK